MLEQGANQHPNISCKAISICNIQVSYSAIRPTISCGTSPHRSINPERDVQLHQRNQQDQNPNHKRTRKPQYITSSPNTKTQNPKTIPLPPPRNPPKTLYQSFRPWSSLCTLRSIEYYWPGLENLNDWRNKDFAG